MTITRWMNVKHRNQFNIQWHDMAWHGMAWHGIAQLRHREEICAIISLALVLDENGYINKLMPLQFARSIYKNCHSIMHNVFHLYTWHCMARQGRRWIECMIVWRKKYIYHDSTIFCLMHQRVNPIIIHIYKYVWIKLFSFHSRFNSLHISRIYIPICITKQH